MNFSEFEYGTSADVEFVARQLEAPAPQRTTTTSSETREPADYGVKHESIFSDPLLWVAGPMLFLFTASVWSIVREHKLKHGDY